MEKMLKFLLLLSLAITFSRADCPENYSEGPDGHCYIFYYSGGSGSFWDSARSSCAYTHGSDLVVIDNQTEYDWLVNLTTAYAPNSSWWIGFSDISSEGNWRWTDCSEATEWQASLWSPGNHDNGREDCGVLLPTGEIDDIVCDARIDYFVCEITPKNYTAEEASPDNLQVNGTASPLRISISWNISLLNCDVYAYRLRVTDDRLETKEKIVYGGDTSSDEVIVTRVNSDYLVTVAALTIMNGELDESRPVEFMTSLCPAGFEESPGRRCYQFRQSTYGEWWNAGRRGCDDVVDGDLVVINDEEELDYVRNRTMEIDPDGLWWIGLSDQASDGNWRWVDCSGSNDWQNRLWAPGFPSQSENMGCAFLYPNGTVQDDICDRRLHSICEITPKEFDPNAVLVDNLAVSGIGTTSLAVTWSVPQYGCDVVGYRIYYSPISVMDKESMYVAGGDITEVIVGDLRANTTYQVSVAVYVNKDYELQESMAVEGTTQACPDYYEEGPNGHCYWFAVTSRGYVWHWGRQDCSAVADSDLVVIDDEEELAYLINRTLELPMDRDWWIGLSGSTPWNWINCMEPSDWQDTLWAPGSPQPDRPGCAVLNESGLVYDTTCDSKHHFICEVYPRGFSFEDQNVETVEATPLMYGMEVRWTLPEKHCDVFGYRVTYTEDVEGARNYFAIQYGSDSTSTIITGLPPNRTYNVTVAALLNIDAELSPIGPIQITTEPCPENYEEGLSGRCYRFRVLSEGTRWMRGRQTCDNVMDSDYAIIDDQMELDYLVSRSAEVDSSMTWWIGLSDLSVPNVWRWIDCSTSSDWQGGLWAPGYPTPQGYTCAALQPSGDVVNLPCETRLSYLCEIFPKGFDSDALMVHDVMTQGASNSLDVLWEIPENSCDVIGYNVYSQRSDGTGGNKTVSVNGGNSTKGVVRGLTVRTSYNVTVSVLTSKEADLAETAPVNGTTVSCPATYEEGPNGHCYGFHLSQGEYWWGWARWECHSEVEHSDLVVINDPQELEFVMNRTAELNASVSWWIGYSDQSLEGEWSWIDCETSDDWQTDLWAPGNPGNGANDCGVLQPTGDIVDDVCDTYHSFICEIAPTDFAWEDASVRDLQATGSMYGLELSWTPSPASCSVVAYRVTYQLDEPGSEVETMILYGGDVMGVVIMDLAPATRYIVGVAVILDMDYELPPVIIYPSTLLCPNNYEAGPNGHCYRFRILETGSWWPTGRRTCDNVEDSDLAIINDDEELKYLLNRSAEVNPNMTWWIGLSDLSVVGDWRWVDCSTPTQFQEGLWAPGSPDSTLGTCAALHPNGTVVDLPCDLRLSYLCELYPKGFDLDSLLVENVTAEGGMYSIDVSWDLPPQSCDAVGYKMYYTPTGSADVDKRSVFAIGGDTTHGTVTGLKVNASYDITVAIYTSKDTELDETESVTAITSPCPTNYEEGPSGHCYRFRILDDGSHWPRGRRTCDDVEDSDFVVINDPDELAYLMQRGAENDLNETWWIGLSDLHIEGEWTWVDCSPRTSYQDTLWAPGYPTDVGYTCAALQPSGDVINLPCDRRFSYFCELSPKGFNLDEQTVENVNTVGGMYRLDVTWDLPASGCNAVGYKIYYQISGTDPEVERSVFVNGGGSVAGTVTGLQANTLYDITVSIWTSKDVELKQTEAVAVSTDPCPEEFEQGPNGRCYSFQVVDPGSWWSTGRRVCDNVADSDLAIINDEVELEFLLKRTSEINSSLSWWIGYSDQSVEGDWRWLDCQTSTTYQSTLWAPGYPGNGRHDCAALRPSGDIVDLVCDDRLSFLCEISPKGFSYDDINPLDLSARGVTYGLEVTWVPSPTSCDAVGYRVTYTLDVSGSGSEFVIVYGGDANSVTVEGLLPGRTYNVTVAAILNQDYELFPRELVSAMIPPCPDGYEEGPNHRCYRFRILDLGSFWNYGRRTCDNEVDSDLAIINDQIELDFLLNRTGEIDPDISWWIGYSDQSVEGDWRWIDCTTSSAWQEDLWVPSRPGNGRLDCAALQPDGQIIDLVCDTSLSYVCEVSPRGFSQDDANVRDVVAVGTTYGVEVSWTVSSTSCDVVAYRVTHYESGDTSTRASTVVYGGDTSSVILRGLKVNTTYDVTVAAYLSNNVELSPVGPVTATTDPCPDSYELAPNGRCYRFISDPTGDFWHYGRGSCQLGKDSDLAIVNDQDELDFLLERMAVINDPRDWWIGYSDVSVRGEWKWVDCTDSNDWQTGLWAPGSPGNVQGCGALLSSGEIEAKGCDAPNSYICEVSPKGFDPMDLKVQSLSAASASYGVDIQWTLPESSCDAYGYKIYYQDEEGQDEEQGRILYGGDTTGARIEGLRPNTTLLISVAVLIVDEELERVGPIMGHSDPCPPKYEEAANGRCYWFSDYGRYGKDFDDARYYCFEQAENFDHDLMIINDQWELEYITNKTREFNDGKDWRIGYSDVSVEGSWKWVTCESSDEWQQALWAPGFPQNGRDDCGVFDPDTMTIYDQVCDVMDINFICEVSPKSFAVGDDNVRDVNASAIAWDTIQVTWNVSEYSCDVVGFNIYYLDTFLGGSPTHVIIFDGEVRSYDLTMLEPSTRYSISVSAERTDAKLPPVGPVNVTTPEGPCFPYYDIGPNGGCYRFVTSQYGSIWASARSACDDVPDSDLVVIDDHLELDYIVNRTKEFDSMRDWWIGFSDFSVESDWRWVTCDAPSTWQSSSLWEAGYPRNGAHDCGALSSSSRRVVDAVCDDPKYYICEVTPKGFTNADMNVRDVMASPVSSTEIRATWMTSNITCNVYGYKVYYGLQSEDFDVTRFMVVYGGNSTSLVVSGLLPSMTYNMYVAALIPDRLELPRMGPANATTYSVCERTILDQDGTIMNVDYPNGYAGPEDCEWLISAPEDQFILLQILDFDTRPGGDFVVIGSGQDFEPGSTLYTLSGSKGSAIIPTIPDKVLSPGREVWLSFRTSESTSDYRGFQISVTMVTQGPGTPVRQYEETTEEGTLSSPGWPDQYQDFVDLTWTLIAPKTGRVRITSLEGALESGYDQLTIGSGSPDSSVLATYTGEIEFSEMLESETYSLWVRFRADESVSDRGFSLFWESFDDEDTCGTYEVDEPFANIMSPNYPDPYPDNQQCTWLIRLPDMTLLVNVIVYSLSLEENQDFLVIGSGKTVNEEVLAILTGDSLPPPIVSTSYRMWIQFRSDESFSSRGFFLGYTSEENPDPPTPYNEVTDSVVFIVLGETAGWFTAVRQEQLSMAIAESMTFYCRDKSDSCEEVQAFGTQDVGTLQLQFRSEDVEFISYSSMGSDLHIVTWVRNPSTTDDDVPVGVEPDVLQTALMDEASQGTITETMGEGFEYNVAPVPADGATPTEETPEPLEPWAIALIVLASFSVVVMASVGLEVRYRRRLKKKVEMSGQNFPIDNMTNGPNGDMPDYAAPLRRSARHAAENKGFNEDEEELTKL